jgi:hypothetical protein
MNDTNTNANSDNPPPLEIAINSGAQVGPADQAQMIPRMPQAIQKRYTKIYRATTGSYMKNRHAF